jgi:hypothetical protein
MQTHTCIKLKYIFALSKHNTREQSQKTYLS